MTASPFPEHGVLCNARADADSHCAAGASEIAIDMLRPCSDLPPATGPVTTPRIPHLSPLRRRQCIDHVRGRLGISERRACRVLGQHRSIVLKSD